MKIILITQCFKVKVYAIVRGALVVEAYIEKQSYSHLGVESKLPWDSYKMDLETWLKSVDVKENYIPIPQL